MMMGFDHGLGLPTRLGRSSHVPQHCNPSTDLLPIKQRPCKLQPNTLKLTIPRHEEQLTASPVGLPRCGQMVGVVLVETLPLTIGRFPDFAISIAGRERSRNAANAVSDR